jgi:hypothetical protein
VSARYSKGWVTQLLDIASEPYIERAEIPVEEQPMLPPLPSIAAASGGAGKAAWRVGKPIPYRALRGPLTEFGAGRLPVSVPKDHRQLPTVPG